MRSSLNMVKFFHATKKKISLSAQCSMRAQHWGPRYVYIKKTDKTITTVGTQSNGQQVTSWKRQMLTCSMRWQKNKNTLRLMSLVHMKNTDVCVAIMDLHGCWRNTQEHTAELMRYGMLSVQLDEQIHSQTASTPENKKRITTQQMRMSTLCCSRWCRKLCLDEFLSRWVKQQHPKVGGEQEPPPSKSYSTRNRETQQ